MSKRGGVPFDMSRPHMARVYDFWLGGKDNFAADRAVAEQVAAVYPDIRLAVRAQRASASRVVYVDNDPIVLSHPQALLSSSPEGATAFIDADLREVGTIIQRAAGVLDFGQPVAGWNRRRGEPPRTGHLCRDRAETLT